MTSWWWQPSTTGPRLWTVAGQYHSFSWKVSIYGSFRKQDPDTDPDYDMELVQNIDRFNRLFTRLFTSVLASLFISVPKFQISLLNHLTCFDHESHPKYWGNPYFWWCRIMIKRHCKKYYGANIIKHCSMTLPETQIIKVSKYLISWHVDHTWTWSLVFCWHDQFINQLPLFSLSSQRQRLCGSHCVGEGIFLILTCYPATNPMHSTPARFPIRAFLYLYRQELAQQVIIDNRSFHFV